MRYLLIILILNIILSNENTFIKDFTDAAIKRTNYDITYDPNYFSISYPNGDIPKHLGVCTDVIIRTYRSIGIDLQKLVHEDMKQDFDVYPSNRIWGHNKPYPSIDHRRVPNLQIFFKRHGEVLPISNNREDYNSGDLVTWKINYNSDTDTWSTDHIGIVVDDLMIVHNIGYGVVLEDKLFNPNFKITGHYKYLPDKYK